MKTLYAAAVGVSLLASPAYAAIELQPGEWQTTETGTENGRPVPPQVDTECMTPEEARAGTNIADDMKKQIQEQGGAQCQTFDVKKSGETVTFTIKCGVPQYFYNITGAYTFLSATRYSGVMKSEIVLAGQKTVSDKKIEAVRVGECKSDAGKK